jgi:hypothetical protein
MQRPERAVTELASRGEHKDENQLGVSAGMIFGVKKNVYNSLDFGTVVLSTYAVGV